MLEQFGQLHPIIVHTPIALLIFSAFFAIVGRLFDREWVRKASVLMLVFGFLGAFGAVRSGLITHEIAEHKQGVPEEAIDEHGDLGEKTMYVAGAALVAVALAAKFSAGGLGAALSGLALLLQIGAAVLVGLTGFHGGKLVYEHGASVKLGGVLVHDVAGAGKAPEGDRDEKPAGAAAVRGLPPDTTATTPDGKR